MVPFDPRNMKRVERIFARLDVIYPSKWRAWMKDDQTANLAKAEWEKDIRPFADGAIAHALEDCKRMNVEWPPTLPQFLQLCKAYRPPAKPALEKLRTESENEAGKEALERIQRDLAAKMRGIG